MIDLLRMGDKYLDSQQIEDQARQARNPSYAEIDRSNVTDSTVKKGVPKYRRKKTVGEAWRNTFQLKTDT